MKKEKIKRVSKKLDVKIVEPVDIVVDTVIEVVKEVELTPKEGT